MERAGWRAQLKQEEKGRRSRPCLRGLEARVHRRDRSTGASEARGAPLKVTCTKAPKGGGTKQPEEDVRCFTLKQRNVGVRTVNRHFLFTSYR